MGFKAAPVDAISTSHRGSKGEYWLEGLLFLYASDLILAHPILGVEASATSQKTIVGGGVLAGQPRPEKRDH